VGALSQCRQQVNKTHSQWRLVCLSVCLCICKCAVHSVDYLPADPSQGAHTVFEAWWTVVIPSPARAAKWYLHAPPGWKPKKSPSLLTVFVMSSVWYWRQTLCSTFWPCTCWNYYYNKSQRRMRCNMKYSKAVLIIFHHISVNPRHPKGKESIHSGFRTFQDVQDAYGLPATCRAKFWYCFTLFYGVLLTLTIFGLWFF
jgi:hypothetical protein